MSFIEIKLNSFIYISIEEFNRRVHFSCHFVRIIPSNVNEDILAMESVVVRDEIEYH